MIKIRAETAQDHAGVAALIERAFGRVDEAQLVDRLRGDGDAVISLIAECDGVIAGHAMLSKMSAPFPALGLGPLSVDPAHQRRGVGAALMGEAIAQARREGWNAIFVLGDHVYYGRFGFEARIAAGFRSPYAGPHFMALPLVEKLQTQTGTVEYAQAFDALG